MLDFVVENGEEAYEKLSFDNVPGHIMNDLMTVVARGQEIGMQQLLLTQLIQQASRGWAH